MLEKWPYLDQNHGLTPFKKLQFSIFWTSCFYSKERRFFVLEYRKNHFPNQYYLKKKGLEKWPYLDQNHRLTPFEKCQFSNFWNLFLLPKSHFPNQFCLKKKVGKMAIFRPNHGLTLLGKLQFFDILNFLFL